MYHVELVCDCMTTALDRHPLSVERERVLITDQTVMSILIGRTGVRDD